LHFTGSGLWQILDETDQVWHFKVGQPLTDVKFKLISADFGIAF
jgi:hypothetical protein